MFGSIGKFLDFFAQCIASLQVISIVNGGTKPIFYRFEYTVRLQLGHDISTIRFPINDFVMLITMLPNIMESNNLYVHQYMLL